MVVVCAAGGEVWADARAGHQHVYVAEGAGGGGHAWHPRDQAQRAHTGPQAADGCRGRYTEHYSCSLLLINVYLGQH